MQIIPAILPKDFREVEDKIELVVGLTKLVQIDICDGKFVPNTTWPYKKPDENFEAILHEEKGMPEWERVNYEFDLMISKPTGDDARKWLSAGAERIVLHSESSEDLTSTLAILNGLVEIGLALNPKTPIENIEKYKDRISYVQLMGIDRVGFQGQKFNSDVVDKVKNIKNKWSDLTVQIDGGVTLENAPLLKDAGVDRLVVGSAIFESEDIVDSYRKFTRI